MMSWDYLFIQSANGAVIGVIYALIAVGVTLIFSILKIVNFAHGDLYMLGGYCAYYVITLFGVPPLAAMFVSMMALFVLAIILERTLLTPLYSDATERKDEYGLIVTFGLAFFLRNMAIIVFGPFPLKPPSFVPGVVRIGNLIVTNDRLFAGVVGIALILALLYFMQRTIWGQALDAVSQSRESAAIVGINTQRFNSFAFGVGAALAAAAGALIAPIFSLAPDMGVLPNIQAYVIVILGGMGSVVGSILAGVVLGETESLFTAFLPDATRALAYTNAFGVLVLMAVLIFRPTGLFGRRHLRME
ncbi:MAG TPA: branched-chain amino acid ABC transporter permease [Alphaproteobacteria bacterium]|nr:branched-chain amino acid ABC transporter permease [Alphaproteobacteria bacterium]